VRTTVATATSKGLLLALAFLLVPAAHAASTVPVDFGGSTKDADASPGTRSVLATGVGLSQEKARQNAFANAIEQTVGLLVDSETLVRNDAIVREQVLTVSRGCIEKFDVLKEWQADGLHHARIRADVAVTRLVEKLKAHNIAVRDIPGERMSRQAKFEIKNEEQAAELFGKIVDDYTIDRLFKVEIDGKPEVVKKDAARATLRVKVNLSPDGEKWAALRTRFEPLLKQMATKRSSFTTKPMRTRAGYVREILIQREVAEDLRSRLDGQGVNFTLLHKGSPNSSVTMWDIYRVPDSLKLLQGLAGSVISQDYHVRVVLLDANGGTVSTASKVIMWSAQPLDIIGQANTSGPPSPGVRAYWLGPALWDIRGHRYLFAQTYEIDVQVELDKLGSVKKVAAFAETAR